LEFANGIVQPVEGWDRAFKVKEGFDEIAAAQARDGFVKVEIRGYGLFVIIVVTVALFALCAVRGENVALIVPSAK
jgi:hypothetical protein